MYNIVLPLNLTRLLYVYRIDTPFYKRQVKMSKQTTTNTYNREEIVKTVKEAALSCYGVNKVVSINEKKGKEEDAIYVHIEKDNIFSLDIHVIVAYGVKVTETIRSLQKTIRFYMNRLYPKACSKINIYADGIASNN